MLEGELNLKPKIVDDFIFSIRDTDIENQNNAANGAKLVQEVQTLDVNLVTNSLKSSHIDYIVLLRKLSQFMEQNKQGNNIMSLTNNRIIEMQREVQAAEEVTLSFEIDTGMRLQNPLSSSEAPNCYVYMKPNLATSDQGQFVQTNVIKSSGYPVWNYKSYNFTVPLTNQNVEYIKNTGALEFEVYHRAYGADSSNFKVQESNHLIGVAFVPLRGLVDGNGRSRISGLYDVVNKGTVF